MNLAYDSDVYDSGRQAPPELADDDRADPEDSEDDEAITEALQLTAVELKQAVEPAGAVALGKGASGAVRSAAFRGVPYAVKELAERRSDGTR